MSRRFGATKLFRMRAMTPFQREDVSVWEERRTIISRDQLPKGLNARSRRSSDLALELAWFKAPAASALASSTTALASRLAWRTVSLASAFAWRTARRALRRTSFNASRVVTDGRDGWVGTSPSSSSSLSEDDDCCCCWAPSSVRGRGRCC